MTSCAEFWPDHNGECLNCDEWIAEHSAAAIEAGVRRADDEALRRGIVEATDDPRELVRRVRDYYSDADRADRTQPEAMYLHLGLLSGVLLRVLDGRLDDGGTK